LKSTLIVILAQLAAHITSTSATADEAYTGVFSESFEMSAFEACNSNERWWLDAIGSANTPFWTQIKELRAEFETKYDLKLNDWSTPFYYLEASGELSELGKHGHMGEYDRQFDLTEINVFRLATAKEQEKCLTSGFYLSTKQSNQ
jgi:hypothetical protein